MGSAWDWLVLQVPLWPLLEGDTVTLRCRGSGDKSVTGVTFYYGDEDVRRMSLRGTEQSLSLSPLQLHHRGRYRCRGSSSSPCRCWRVPPEITEGSPLNLSCLSTPSPLRPRAPLLHLFYRDGQRVGGPQESPQLRVPAVGVSDSGNYSCQVRSESGTVRKNSSNVHVTVRRVPPSGVSLRAQPPGAQVALGDRLELRCAVAAGTGPLSFSWHRGGSGAPLGTGPRLELRRLGDNDSGRYHCRVSDGDSVAESVPLNVTVLVPVANATVTPGPPALRVRAGEPVTLRCSVQVGSAPVTFTWLRDGQEVARGPLLELGDTERRHSGTYQCVATNQLGRDGHRVFQALSAELALEVTTWGHRDTAVAAGVGASLVSLLLIAAAIAGWHRHHRRAPRTPQHRSPAVPPDEGEVLYSHVVPAQGTAGSPGATPEVPQVTYAELAAPRWHPGDSGDYENVL
ncbi:Fc receptor-like protein 6 [Hirundo rustica]|uniref:Fc receptor-like protein 6 n=1 Tax=Hirundo rustica TaxID=43150 RepID=UPI002673EFCF|nr:Fc receptor-like protein 6 [Hirundo rustica]